jgi:rod shape-determining protein MreC
MPCAPVAPMAPLDRIPRRRLVLGILVLAALGLLTGYFREGDAGSLHGAQRQAVSVSGPFESAAQRVARPFRDVAGWVRDVNRARSQRDKAEAENQILRERNAELTQQAADADNLRTQLKFTKDSTNFGLVGYRKVSADVSGRSPGLFNSRITIEAGTADGIRKNDAVVTGPGWLVGHTGQVGAHESEVVLINDPGSQVSASVPAENAAGSVRPSAGNRNVLVLDYVSKARRVKTGEVVLTTGWSDGATGLRSIYPRGLAIGNVTSSAATDTDLYREIQVTPSADLQSFSTVTVFVRRESGSG